MNLAQRVIALHEESETGFLQSRSTPRAGNANSDAYKLQLKFRTLREKLGAIRSIIDPKKKNSNEYRKFEDALIELGNLGMDIAKNI